MNFQQKPTAVALGLFDGVHLGHRRVLETALQQKQNGLVPCAFTFQSETMGAKRGTAVSYIYTTEQKRRIMMDDCGMEQVTCPAFAEVQNLDGEEFARTHLKERLHAAFVCCGRDFRFGRHAACGAEDLRRFGEKYGFAVEFAEDVLAEGTSISSTRIRQLLQGGCVDAANVLLGAPYTMEQEVVHGAQLGRTIGFPTINQVYAEGQLVPKYGVYATSTQADGIWYPSVTNVGMKPTVQYAGQPLAETHIIGFQGDVYGKRLRVRFHRFIRPEQRFSSVEELQAQLRRDMECAGKEN